ncbi:hypothetical protein PR048_029478 [Dryococelus australis]|uniref:Uncharacterized protein n=1 Tax=Dryococelus australis TaxID=614101 RepID=A0ABQ9GDK0_9NEOP|nr:hypothetical protein PR048_029478 [Dryococelus australis]
MRVIEVSMEQWRNEGAGENGKSPRKPAYQRHRPARFPHAKNRKGPGRRLNPVGQCWVHAQKTTMGLARRGQIPGYALDVRAELVSALDRTCYPASKNMDPEYPWLVSEHRVLSIYRLDRIDVKHVYTEVDFVIGSQFIRHALDDSDPKADLQENK